MNVKTLIGISLSLGLDPSDTSVGALRQRLHEQGHEQLKGCRLFFNGIKLQDEQAPLPSAATHVGAFLVAVPVSSSARGNVSRHVRAVRQHEERAAICLEAPPAVTLLNSSAQDSGDAVPYRGREIGQLDTLLTGYAIRPSPVKPRAKPAQVPAADEVQQEGGGGFLPAEATAAAEGEHKAHSPLNHHPGRPGSPEPLPGDSLDASDRHPQRKRQRRGKQSLPGDGSASVAGPPAEPAATAAVPRAMRKRKGIKAAESEAEGDQQGASAPPPPPLANAPSDQRTATERLVSRLPLPPALLQLRQILAALGEVHRFLSTQRVSPTWHALATVLDQAQGQQSGPEREGRQAGLMLEDVFHLAAIVPAVVVLKDRSRPHDDEAVVCPRRMPGPSSVALGGSGGGCIEADATAQGWPSQLIQQVTSSLGQATEEGGAGEKLGACPPTDVTHHSLVVDIVDPGRWVDSVMICGQVSLSGYSSCEIALSDHCSQTVISGCMWIECELRHCSPHRILSRPPDGESKGLHLSTTPAALLSRCGALGANKVDRCLAAFSRSAVVAVLQLQSQFLAQLAQQSCADGVTEWEGPEPDKAADQEPLDSVQAGQWHPRFPWQSVSIPEAIQAIRTLQRGALQPPNAALGDEAVAGPGHGPIREASSSSSSIATLPMSPTELLAHLKELVLVDRMVHEEHLPARAARHAQPRTTLDPAVLQALRARGASRMFSHQAEAIDGILGEGRHTVIATSTASGK